MSTTTRPLGGGSATDAAPAGRPRQPWRPGPPLLALATGWIALFAWSGMVADPMTFLIPTLMVGFVMTMAGSGLRVLRASPYVVAGVQPLLGLLAMNLIFAARWSYLGVVPTVSSLREVGYVVSNGAATLNAYTAPVSVNPTHTRALLMACGLAVLFVVDVLAFGVRRTPLVALPLLVTLSVPISILTNNLALPVFVGTALLFMRLMATEHTQRLGTWGGTHPAQGGPRLNVLWLVSVTAVVAALVVAPLVPVTDLLHRNRGTGDGSGSGGGAFELTTVNPFIHMQRDLVEQTHTPLLFAKTTALDTRYIRTTVLDEFTGDEWRPSPRNLPGSNNANGHFPSPPGLGPSVERSTAQWSFALAPQFTTTWLPLPYPIDRLSVSQGWRYDSRTLDVADVDGPSQSGLTYSATALIPDITAQLLQSSPPPPKKLVDSMTKLPVGLPEVVRATAKDVTRGAKTEYERALALQDWFRRGGGFQYSLNARAGSGMQLLADFLTRDRVGYCEQFAAAMATLGRVLGIPSRVAVGFLDGTPQADGKILYTSDDRHAWPEMYFAGVGWVRFEPTPGQRTGATPEYTRQSLNDPTAPVQTAPTTAPTRAPDRSTAAAEQAQNQAAKQHLPLWPFAALVVLVLVLVAPSAVRRVQRRRRLSAADPVHLAEGAWAELRATALDLGLDWPDQRSPREQARTVVGQVRPEPDAASSLEGLLVQVERGRYGRAGTVATLDLEDRVRTLETVDSWRQVMLRSVVRQRSLRGRVWPISLLRGWDLRRR